MEQLISPMWKAILVALVRRREPRGIGLYTICAILVGLYALITLYGVGAEASRVTAHMFLVPALWLSVPIAVVLVQRWRQTVLGWALVLAEFAGATVFALALNYSLIQDGLVEPWPLTILATLIAICVGLVWHRPTRGK
jgi:hypothetical protein